MVRLSGVCLGHEVPVSCRGVLLSCVVILCVKFRAFMCRWAEGLVILVARMLLLRACS